MNDQVKVILAIDPGHAKCGFALARRESDGSVSLLWHKVEPTDSLIEAVSEAGDHEDFSMVVIGSGTESKMVTEKVREHLPSIGILVVDEKDTSLQARELYWRHNPRRGWRFLLPASMQVPPEPIDDFAALVMARRVLMD
jgi:RNase H-fold protein (predicted Holliday junction resolvase)